VVNAIMRLNFTQPGLEPRQMSARYQAGIEMAVWGERHGLSAITHEEHHGVPNGWSPSPLVTAGAILARTTRIEVRLQALLLPLHDPLRVAEDIAVLDLLSGGRLVTIVGIGHREYEYRAHGKDFAARGALMDECVDTLLKAWTGEPFAYRDTTVQVTPRPLTSPHPPLYIGGNSKVAVRRAARFHLPIWLAAALPEVVAHYHDQCRAHGWDGVALTPEPGFLHHFIVDDPDRAWAELGPHLLHETTTYSSWSSPKHKSAVHTVAQSVDDLRRNGMYRFVTPDEAIAMARASGENFEFHLHPLCGGIPIDAAWDMLERYADRVVPALPVAEVQS
jgi:alkanesulfonate monooxygenase SsuD/methylene tetrahydromethanopterin reductase-like flavin-dependent oxidoreductase (luciferase family)